MQPKISIIIPTKNGENTIDDCLTAIFNQTLIVETEVIIIDSGSMDKTLEIAKKYPVRLYHIPPHDFGHGKTRNYGVSLAQGEFIVMTVQDAKASSDKWLEIMLQHFDNKEIVGVCGQQVVPHEKDKNPVEWHRPINKSGFKEVQFSKLEYEQLSEKQLWQNCRWDDVNAMYRKSVLLEIPFKDVEFGEDMIWAKNALITGHKIVYDMNSQVFHYHHYTDKKRIYARILLSYKFTYQTFNYLRPNPYNIKYFVRLFYLFYKFKISPKWWYYNFKLLLNSYFATKKAIKIGKLNHS
jgi:rhamnosyltransferase